MRLRLCGAGTCIFVCFQGCHRLLALTPRLAPLMIVVHYALYTLLKLEGHPCDLRAIEAALPPPRVEGYNMRELKYAAQRCGLSVDGVRLPRDESALDCSAIMFVRCNGHGHYFVVRPVGHTGKLVEIIDSGRNLDVVDYSALRARSEWAGLALIPYRFNLYAWIAGTFAAPFLALSLACRIIPGLHRTGSRRLFGLLPLRDNEPQRQ